MLYDEEMEPVGTQAHTPDVNVSSEPAEVRPVVTEYIGVKPGY
jgi:hypothetical protein